MRPLHTAFFLVAASLPWLAVTATAADADTATPAPITIVTSFYPMYIHTLNIAGGVPGVSLRNLTAQTTGCLHDYQLRPEEMITIAKAGVFVVNGAGMEAFLDKALQQFPALKIVDASRGLELIRENGRVNPHVWVSVSGAIGQVRNIADGLAAADPARAAQYRANAAAYTARLEALRTRMQDGLNEFRGRGIITFHEAFPYFAREFGLTVSTVIEREPGSDPSPQELVRTVELVKKAGARALFAEPQYPAKAAETVARETGAKVWSLDPCVTGPAEPGAYLQAMERNLATLREALR